MTEQEYLKKKRQKGSKGVYFDSSKGIYRRIYRGRRWKMLKKVSNHKLRHSKNDKPSKKEFDIDWIYF